jgi:2-oxoglutarate dehydrogenase E2 component (dihydrolipoamide succinyltransferase)
MATEIRVPELGESIVEATVADWLKQEGDRVEVGEAVVVLETDKVDLDVGAEKAGVIARIERQQGEDVKIGDVLGVIEEVDEDIDTAPGESELTKAAESDGGRAETPETASQEGVKKDGKEKTKPTITPVAQRLALEQDVDITQVSASGPQGRVTKEDVERYLSEQSKASPPESDQKPRDGKRESIALQEPVALPPDSGRREERQRLSRRRRTIAARLVEAQHTAAMLTTFNEVDMTAIMALRERRQSSFVERYSVKLGIASFFVKAAVGALKTFPEVNSELQGDELILKYYYDIGVAIGAPEGLVVPVLRDADRLSFAEIERAIKDMAQRATEGQLTLDELRGGTFTITNGGVFGSLMSTPILNQPQVGILGLHKIEERPIAIDGEVVIRPMMYVALSYDHRVIDGREAVQFLVRVKELVEDPETLLLEG